MDIYVGAQVRSVTIEPDWDDGPERFADIQVEWPLEKFTARELHQKSVLRTVPGLVQMKQTVQFVMPQKGQEMDSPAKQTIAF